MAQKILAVLIWEEAVKKWPLSGWPACLQSGHDLAGRFGRVIPLYGTLGPAGLRELLTAVRRSLASSAARISSSKEVRTWDISGFIEVRVRDLNSVLYLGFTSLGKSGWISLSQVRAMKFSYVGVSSSSSVATSPWWDRPLARSNVSSTKGHQSLKEILGRFSVSRCKFAESRKRASVTWRPKCSRIVFETDWMEVKFFTRVVLDMTGK